MDIAERFVFDALTHQKPMNAVIDRGDSPVQQFYNGAAVFVTGGSGFLGKQLIEKLFRSCQVKKVYVLLRSKKGRTMQERLDFTLKDPVFDVVRKKHPNFAERIVPVEGDVADIKFGLSEKDWTLLTEEVDTIFHMAATIRFDEPLRVATFINVRGTRECLNLAKQCVNLKNFVHVSTAFTHATMDRVGQPILEQFYPCPVPPDIIIQMAETMDEERLNGITNELIKGWPNTYTFTKAIAEEVVRSTAGELPVCVVRPPIVLSCYYEPMPGWTDLSTVSGPTGIIFGIIIGILHVFYVDKHCKLPMTPVDYVNNATIAAAWDAAERRKDGDGKIPVYTVSNKDYFITWDFIGRIMRSNSNASTPKAIWYCYLVEVTNKHVYWFLSLLLHYIPAYAMDGVGKLLGKMPKGVKSFVSIFRKVDKFALIYRFFLSNEWGFCDDNVQAMVTRMSDADKAIFNCDIKTIDFNEFVKIWAIGIRQYIIKDNLKDSDVAYKRQLVFRACNYVLIGLYVLFFSYVLCKCWSLINYMI